MKRKLLLSLMMAAIMFIYQGNAQINTPQPSPKAKVESTVGLTEIGISYFRPGVKGRMVFGEGKDYLQPYGQLWRAGANSGTILSLSTDAKIAGKEVKAGEYLIFMTPGKDNFEFKLYSDLSLGGNVNGYDEAKELLTASAKAEKIEKKVETLTYLVSDISEDNTKANIHFMWENTSVKIPIEVSFDEQVMADIASKTRVNSSNLVAAANYYLATDQNLEQALAWMNTYLAEGNNSQQFWHVHTKAKILAKMGKNKEAKEVAMKSIEMAKASPQGDFGYIQRNEVLIKTL